MSKTKPDGYDELVKKINAYVEDKGGWLNTIPVER
jgi:hypothetical protein